MSFRDTLRGMLDEALEASGVPRHQPINYPRPVEQPAQGQQGPAGARSTRPSGETEATERPRRAEETRPRTRGAEEPPRERPRRPAPPPDATPTDEQRRAEQRQPHPARVPTPRGGRTSVARRAAIRRALASPAGAQQALILGEILGPPLALRPLDEDR